MSPTSESAVRLMIGLPVAALFPLGVPGLREDFKVHLCTGLGYGAFILAPAFPGWRSWVLLALTGAACAGARLRLGPSRGVAAETPWIRSLFEARHIALVAVALVLAVAAGLVAGPSVLGGDLSALVHSDRVAFVSAGALTAVFLGGAIVEQVLQPHTETLRLKSVALPQEPSEIKALVGAGMLIGWLERAIVFALVMAGQTTAAALTLTAKSVARFPALRRNEEGFAEYFLIGSLTSLLAAVGPALATHWLLATASSR